MLNSVPVAWLKVAFSIFTGKRIISSTITGAELGVFGMSSLSPVLPTCCPRGELCVLPAQGMGSAHTHSSSPTVPPHCSFRDEKCLCPLSLSKEEFSPLHKYHSPGSGLKLPLAPAYHVEKFLLNRLMTFRSQ